MNPGRIGLSHFPDPIWIASKCIGSQVRRIEAGHMAAARKFAQSAPGKRLNPEDMKKGEAVLAFYEDGRWDRLLSMSIV